MAPNSRPKTPPLALDDIYPASSPTSDLPSDVPRLRAAHVTNGYRDGLDVGKTTETVQAGFDEGYALGAELGLAAGRVLGVLHGLVAALRADADAVEGVVETDGTDERESQEGESTKDRATSLAELETMHESAVVKLALKSLFAAEYFDTSGTWLYDVPGHEDDVVFRDVALAHPLVQTWALKVRDSCAKYGVPDMVDSLPTSEKEDEEEKELSD